jgi:Rad3-related DNA helicase
VVAILDSRLARKGYGKTLLRSLPPARRCRSMHEVSEAFGGASLDGDRA